MKSVLLISVIVKAMAAAGYAEAALRLRPLAMNCYKSAATISADAAAAEPTAIVNQGSFCATSIVKKFRGNRC